TMQRRTINDDKIEFMWDTELEEDLGAEEVDGGKVINNETQEITELDDVSGEFSGIGHKPNTDLLKGVLEIDDAGYLIIKGDSTETDLEGVFASGDAMDPVYRQAVTAAGTGCRAALDAERFLAEQAVRETVAAE